MKDIKNTNEKDLMKALEEKRVALKAFKLSLAGSKPKNIREGRVLRKSIAQIMTELRSRKA